MQRGARLATERAVSASGQTALARVHLGVLQPRPQLSADSVQVVFHGELFNRTELRSRVGAPTDATDVAIVRALYAQSGDGCASALKGSFCLAVVDEARRRLVLATDRLASYPLYWHHASGVLLFGSEVRALVKGQAHAAIDPLALNDLLQFGFPTGTRTLASQVQLLPGGSTLVFHGDTDTVRVTRYHAWGGVFNLNTASKARYLDAVTAAFETSMSRAIAGEHRYGLSLSGGLDTRVMLAVLDRQRVPLQTFTLGGRGCADEVIGNQLAKMAGTRHQFMPLEEGYLSDLRSKAAQMTSLSDGMYTSDGFTELLALQSFAATDVNMLLRGHLGELAKAGTAYPFHTDARIQVMTTKDELLEYLFARQESLNVGSRAQGLFTPQWASAEGRGVALEALRHAADADLAPADLCSYLYLTEYHRRVTVPSLEIFREVAEVRLPLADEDFVEAVVGGQRDWRNGVEIHQTLVRRINPKFLKVRNPNTGAPAGAGPLEEFVRDKINSVLRRLNVYGYRHYHSFDGWMRQAFVNILDEVLLTPQSLGRGVCEPDVLRQMVAAAKQGDKTPDHVLQVLVVAELWQIENL
ncbi:MAG: asparagine synthase-related protein [Vicinamibacterales bacterium]